MATTVRTRTRLTKRLPPDPSANDEFKEAHKAALACALHPLADSGTSSAPGVAGGLPDLASLSNLSLADNQMSMIVGDKLILGLQTIDSFKKR
jgi:hypothetical protein